MSILDLLMFQTPHRCGFCESYLNEILEAREVSYYLLADFQPLQDTKNLVTFKICGNDKIEYLALGEKYEVVGKAIGQESIYQCFHLVPIENMLSKFLPMSYELNAELYQIFQQRYCNSICL